MSDPDARREAGVIAVRPGEIVALVSPPPVAIGPLVQRCRVAAPELVVVDATVAGALTDLRGLRGLSSSQRARLGIAVLVVTDDSASVAGLADRTVDGPAPLRPTGFDRHRPLLLTDVDDDIAYLGVLDDVPGARPSGFRPPRLVRALREVLPGMGLPQRLTAG